MDEPGKRTKDGVVTPATGAAAGKPGDESPPGSRQSGEAVCPDCAGTCVREGRRCRSCAGSGTVTVLIGDA